MIRAKSVAGQPAPPQSPSCGNGRLHASEAGVPFPFIAFPQKALDLLTRGKIKLVDVGVLVVILKFRKNGRMTAWVKTETITRLANMSEPTIHRSLRRLTQAGLIERQSCGRPDPLDPENMTGHSFALLFQVSMHALGVSPVTVSPVTVSPVTPNSDGRKHSDGRKQKDDDDEPATSSSSFAALPKGPGGTGGTKPKAKTIDPARLKAAVARLVALGLRRDKGDADPLDAERAEKLILGAARQWSGGLRWVAWAIHQAAKRRNAAKGKKAVEVWGWIVGTLRHWEQEESGPPESDGWPGENGKAAHGTQPRKDSVCNARS